MKRNRINKEIKYVERKKELKRRDVKKERKQKMKRKKRKEEKRRKKGGGGGGGTEKTRRSVEHCTPHADGAWLNELGWVTVVMVKLRKSFFRKQNSTQASTV